MPVPTRLLLQEAQVKELTKVRDHHDKPYMRTKAAAILKVAQGASIRQVAQRGLLKAVRWETVRDWIERYQQEGIDGLRVKAGRGRKPAFSPCKAEQDAGHRTARGTGASTSQPVRR